MRFFKELQLENIQNQMLSFVGGGGKTSSIFHLANGLRDMGKRVLISTTTAIYSPSPEKYQSLILLKEKSNIPLPTPKPGEIVVMGKHNAKENKLQAVDLRLLERIHRQGIFDYILIEADGAKKKPVKAPEVHEPVIPTTTNKLFGVIGLDSIGKGITDNIVHRSQRFAQITGSEVGSIITEETLYRLIKHPYGIFKGSPNACEKYLILNKADNPIRYQNALGLVELIRVGRLPVKGIFVNSYMADKSTFFQGRD